MVATKVIVTTEKVFDLAVGKEKLEQVNLIVGPTPWE